MKLEMEKWQSGEDVVRAITLDDAADFYEIVKQPPLYAALWWQAESVEACARQIQVVHLSYRQKQLPQTMVIERNEQMIGLLHVSRMEDDLIEIGYFLHPAYWRQGIMKRVLAEWLKRLSRQFLLHRIEAYCACDNTASIALLKSCGFHYEGRLREVCKDQNGAYQDMLLYALIVSDRVKEEIG